MSEVTFGCVTLVHGDSQIDIGKQNEASYDLVIHDPPFEWEADQSLTRLIQSERILNIGGNFVSVNYPITNMDIYVLIKKHCPNLFLKDTINIKQGTAYKVIRGLPRRRMTINVYHKGPVTKRKYYGNSNMGKVGHAIYAPENLGILTDIMDYRQHYPNRYGKHKKLVQKGAMAKWLVKNILYCYVREGDSVYDSFGGAGTFPAICRVNNVNCRSVELDKSNFNLMNKELKDHSKYRTLKIMNAFIELAGRLNENNSRTTNIVELRTQRRTNNYSKTAES